MTLFSNLLSHKILFRTSFYYQTFHWKAFSFFGLLSFRLCISSLFISTFLVFFSKKSGSISVLRSLSFNLKESNLTHWRVGVLTKNLQIFELHLDTLHSFTEFHKLPEFKIDRKSTLNGFEFWNFKIKRRSRGLLEDGCIRDDCRLTSWIH